jgi:hypothetical protein
MSEAPELWSGLVAWWPLQEGGGATARDLSGNDNDGALTNMEPATDWPAWDKGRAVDLDGSNEHVRANSDCGITSYPFTLAAWAETDALHAVGANGLVGLFDSSAINVIYGIETVRGVNTPAIYAFNGGSFFSASGSTNTLNTGWHFFVGVFESNTLKRLYVNGRLEATLTNNVTFNTATDVVDFGRHGDSSPTAYQDGRVANVCVWNRIVLPSEILRLYTAPWAMGRLRRRVFKSGAAAPAFAGSSQIIGAGIIGGQGV